MAEEIKSPDQPTSTPLQNLLGALVSGAIGTGLYFFTTNLAHKLALSPFRSTDTLAAKVAAAVRTILLALSSGATMIFGVIALGLVLLTMQQIWHFMRAQLTTAKDAK